MIEAFLRLRAFCSVSPFSITDTDFQRGLAITTALFAHGLIALVITSTPPEKPAQAPHVVTVNFAFEPPPVIVSAANAPAPTPEAEVEARSVGPQQRPDRNEQADAGATDPASARSSPDTTTPLTDSPDNAYPLRPGTRSVLRGIQCPGDPDAFARTGICPQTARQHSQMIANEETARDFYTIDLNAIQALYGRAPHALSGQATLADGTQRRSLSNADSIRETLPASQPDPAFGD